MAFATADVLDAIQDIAYLVDADGTIVDIGEHSWSGFADRNRGKSIVGRATVVGRSMFDFVSGAAVTNAYRQYMAALKTGDVDAVSFDYRCDAPQTKREMRMTITPVRHDGSTEGYLFQSVLLYERARPAIALFDTEWIAKIGEADTNLPMIGQCSYCHNVRMPSTDCDDSEQWIEAEDYYRLGGPGEVQISHGICPTCEETKIKQLLRQ